MNKDKVYLKGYVIGRAADTLGYEGLMVQLENLDVVEIDKNLVHRDINEPQKVTVQQFVADWIKYCKNTNVTMTRALLVGEVDFYNYANQEDFSELKEFLETKNNQETFARAWLDGYEVEKEKRYLVKMKGLETDEAYLKFQLDDKYWYMGIFEEYKHARVKHTKTELEEAGFGWVFDCPGIEIEEVGE